MNVMLTANQRRPPEYQILLTSYWGLQDLTRNLSHLIRCEAQPTMMNRINRRASAALKETGADTLLADALEACERALKSVDAELQPFIVAENEECDRIEAERRAARPVTNADAASLATMGPLFAAIEASAS